MENLEQLGRELISERKCALIVLAGGMGSRLGFEGPKGCFPISNVKKKSLYQLVAERVKCASDLYQKPLEVAFMTSPLNEEATQAHFKEQNYFGLKKEQLHFFCQNMWPLLDEKEQPLSTMGPRGNGEVFSCLTQSPIWQRWQNLGIKIINLIAIDNPLAEPFDAGLFGFHVKEENEVTIKADFRKSIDEKVGVLVIRDGRITVVEYSEAAIEGHLLANLGLYCFSSDFVQRVAQVDLPIHKAKKYVPALEGYAWKREQFIFDLFPLSKKSSIFFTSRKECFAPLKNFEGEDSIGDVQKALFERDCKTFARISGMNPLEGQFFELATEFHYPTKSLMRKWKGKKLPTEPYIEGT